MIWSSSALRRDCAYPNILDAQRKAEPLPAAVQKALDQLANEWRDKWTGPRVPTEVKAVVKLKVAGIRGHKLHAAIEQWKREGKVPNAFPGTELQEWLDKLSETWDPGEAEAIHLETAWGLSPSGDHVMVSVPRPLEYESLDGSPLLTAGRCDLDEHFGSGVLYTVDWKTGKWRVEPAKTNLQVNAAGIALAKRRGMRAYQPGIYYARDGEWDWGDVVELGSQAEADIFADIRAAATLPASPLPGPHCESCWESRKGRCPAAWKGAA